MTVVLMGVAVAAVGVGVALVVAEGAEAVVARGGGGGGGGAAQWRWRRGDTFGERRCGGDRTDERRAADVARGRRQELGKMTLTDVYSTVSPRALRADRIVGRAAWLLPLP